jgi:hypothetical protein
MIRERAGKSGPRSTGFNFISAPRTPPLSAVFPRTLLIRKPPTIRKSRFPVSATEAASHINVIAKSEI